MGLKNKSMYAILGILNLSPSTGYDIKKYSDQVLSGFWNENFGHIYPTLKMLLRDGMIEATEQGSKMQSESMSDATTDTVESGTNKRAERKQRYRITNKGRQELQQWLVEETIQQPVRSEFMLKLLFSDRQSKEHLVQMLGAYQKQYEQNLVRYNAMLAKLGNDTAITKQRAVFLRAVLRRGILSDEAAIRWCKETVDLFGGDE